MVYGPSGIGLAIFGNSVPFSGLGRDRQQYS